MLIGHYKDRDIKEDIVGNNNRNDGSLNNSDHVNDSEYNTYGNSHGNDMHKNLTKDDICNNDNIFSEKEHTMCTDDNDECNDIDNNNENSNHNDEIM